MADENLKVALPKGKLLADTAALLERAGWGIRGYTEGARSYRLSSGRFPGMLAKIFHERDIPVQVAVGNYDVGICGMDWVKELTVKYPSSDILTLRELGYGFGSLVMAASRNGRFSGKESFRAEKGLIRIAGEYPNLAESFAMQNRLRRFSVFPLWGAADGYPPESAELALLSLLGESRLPDDLLPVENVLEYGACLIVNRMSWERVNLSELLNSLDACLPVETNRPARPVIAIRDFDTRGVPARQDDANVIRLALPDGHQQKPTVALLKKAGIKVEDYPMTRGNRRLASSLEGVAIKVIRPQDMPLQVANGNFDLAVTGRDWVTDHLFQFPASPVIELLDLKYAGVRIVAVVSNDMPVEDIEGMREFFSEPSRTIRVASEYVNLADKYARDNQLGVYKVIPTWGATEAFLPEDADLLIENTETGGTIARHNLKIIDTPYTSTACLVGNKDSIADPARSGKIDTIIEILRSAIAND